MKKHIVDKAVPFYNELLDLITLVIEPLNNPDFEFIVEEDGDYIYFSYSGQDSSVAVEYQVKIDAAAWPVESMSIAMKDFIVAEFTLRKDGVEVGKGELQLQADTNSDILEEWIT